MNRSAACLCLLRVNLSCVVVAFTQRALGLADGAYGVVQLTDLLLDALLSAALSSASAWNSRSTSALLEGHTLHGANTNTKRKRVI